VKSKKRKRRFEKKRAHSNLIKRQGKKVEEPVLLRKGPSQKWKGLNKPKKMVLDVKKERERKLRQGKRKGKKGMGVRKKLGVREGVK